MVYKSLNKLVPQYMVDMFKLAPECSMTRSRERSYKRNELVLPPGVHKVIFEKSFRYSAIEIWNDIDPIIRNCDSINSFKSAYLRDYFSNQTQN